MPNPNCPSCNSPMTLRESRHGKFWGCSTFPQCRQTMDAPDDAVSKLPETSTEYKSGDIAKLIFENCLKDSYDYWDSMMDHLVDIWDKPTSSTGKYHRRADGTIPSIAEHTYEMLNAGLKVMRLLGFKSKSSEGDAFLIAIALHDGMKYGKDGTRQHTTSDRDKLMADFIHNSKTVPDSINMHVMEKSIRYHSGRWSTNLKNEGDGINGLGHTEMLVHTLDMLSAADLLKT